MYATMLMAVDGTDTARHALEQGLVLARSEEARAVIVSVVPSYDGDLRLLGDTSALDAMREPYKAALDRAAARAAEMGVPSETVLLEGDPVEELLDLAQDRNVDCMVLGKRGNFYSDLIPIGSVASKVARLAGSDVLLVPLHKELRPESMLIPYDGSDHAYVAARRALELAMRYGSSVCLATVYELPLEGFAQGPHLGKVFHEKAAETQRPVQDLAEQLGVRNLDVVVRQGMPVHRVLTELIHERDVGLVVMSNVGRGNLHLLLMGKVTERIIGGGAAPVLLARKDNARQ